MYNINWNLTRASFPGTDLDLYVPKQYAGDVAQWLVTKEGYKYEANEEQIADFEETLAVAMDIGPEDARPNEPYRNSGLIGVFNFVKDDRPVVQLIATAVSPIHSILSFHSSK